mmetsp:Transcript_127346/g.220741  ORF Transcript_127346/g.220741 Transcript_127346/m.220741 type:complete len:204 (+) Transcript_127346:106-717(+)
MSLMRTVTLLLINTCCVAQSYLEEDLVEGVQLLQMKGNKKLHSNRQLLEMISESVAVHAYNEEHAVENNPETFRPDSANWKNDGNCIEEPYLGMNETLDDEGYQKVGWTCCNFQMEMYLRRLVVEMGLKVCNEGGFMGFVPWFTCEKQNDYAKVHDMMILKENILFNSQSANETGQGCGFLTDAGKKCIQMKNLPQACQPKIW